MPAPEGTEDLHNLLQISPIVFHAQVVSIDAIGPPPAGLIVQPAQVASLRVDRWYKGNPRPSTVQLKYVYPGWEGGEDCIDLHRSSSWLIFARLRSDGAYQFVDSCEGGLPMSAILAPTEKKDCLDQLQADLIAGFQDSDPALRLANIARLGGLKLRSSSVALRKIMEDGMADEQAWATYATLRSGDFTAMGKAASILIDADESLWQRGWYRTSPPDAAPSSEPVMNIAFEIERDVRDSKVVPTLIKILGEAKSDWARSSAMGALQDIKDPRSLPAAVAHLSDSSFAIQHHALVAVNGITGAAECEAPVGSNESELLAAVETCTRWWQETGSRKWATQSAHQTK
jgi:hypothetical protein